ncbi:MAG: substrate-binding domain-containing protein [Methylobacteriaceae bacterium]|nr:substrate-binding domain-containing protein [Methylobacteriaceae bacterium]
MRGLRGLANQLGLSITTVSRALDGYDDVAAETRERVRRAADAAGYRPNPIARRLRKGASETIALVMPTEPGRFFEAAFEQLLAVVGAHLAEKRYDLMLLAARPGRDEQMVYERIIRERRADACLVLRTRRNDPRVALLQGAGMPFVCHGRTDCERPYAFVDGDGAAGFFGLTARLIGLGHRRIAFLGAPDDLMFSSYRRAGWRRALAQADLADDLVLALPATESEGENAAARLMARADAPSALVCATDRIAIGAVRAAQAAGLLVGRDVAIAGHDNIHAAQHLSPPLTTMELDVAAVGARMARMTLALLAGAKADGMQEVFTPRQILRESTGEAGAQDPTGQSTMQGRTT